MRTVGDDPSFTASARLGDAANAWLRVVEERVERGTRSHSTLDLYRHAVERHVGPGLGDLRLGELTVPRVDRFLQHVFQAKGYSTAKLCRTVLGFLRLTRATLVRQSLGWGNAPSHRVDGRSTSE